MSNGTPWYNNDWSEELCILCITLIAVSAILYLGAEASNIVSAVGGGLVGYLTRGASKSS